MKDIHIALIGEWFHDQDGFDFLSDQNMLEYDFIVIESDVFIKTIRDGFVTKVKERIADLKDFIALKNIPVVFICYDGGKFYPQISDTPLTITSVMGAEATETPAIGRKIETNPDSLFSDFMQRYSKSFEYKLSFSDHPGTSIGKARGKTNSIGFYTKDVVFLPALVEEDALDNETAFLHKLYNICLSVRKSDDALQVPEWTNAYFLPGEKDEKDKLDAINKEIENLQSARIKSEMAIANFVPLKQLWTASGTALENAVKDVFLELGFLVLPSEARRDDIIMEFNKQIIIVEIKGQSKSAAEKNAAQLEKWLSTYISNHDGANPKGLLIVNTFREQRLEDRIQSSFPDQMLTYSNARNHCLLTTLQLCCVLLHCRQNPTQKGKIIEKLLTTVGRYEGFDNWSELIYIDKKHLKETRTKKQLDKQNKGL